jgi:flagellar hook protein FlgE
MSLFQSLNIGVSGIRAQSNVIGVVSDNLANVSTVGYKKSSANFRNLVVHDNLVAGYAPGGAISGNRHLNSVQGPITFTESGTDIAISGGGYFAVRENNSTTGRLLYTRAGSFLPNSDGDFTNGAGFFLQGWLLDANGNLPAAVASNTVVGATAIANLVPVNPHNITLTPIATTIAELRTNLRAAQAAFANSSVAMQANLNAAQLPLPTGNVSIVANLNSTQIAHAGLYDPTVTTTNMASGAVSPQFTRIISVLDANGTAHNVNVGFLKTGADTWAVEVYARPAGDVTQADGQLAFGTVTFNPDGSLATVSPALTSSINAGWNNPGGATNIDFDLGTIGALDGLSQSSAAYSSSYTARPDYDPASLTLSMTAGGITPHYTATVNVVDDTGVTRNLNVYFLKTGVNSWAIEIAANPTSDITSAPGAVPGQVASGTATFNSSGTLVSISPSLSNPVAVAWNNNPTANNVSFNWPANGTFPGITQNTAAFSSSLTSALNYDPSDPLFNMNSGTVASHFNTVVSIIDPTGAAHTIKVAYLKTGVNTWAAEVYADPAADLNAPSAQIASGILTFNGDGSLASVSPALSAALPMSWTNGEANSVTIDWGTAGALPGTVGATVFGDVDGLSQLNSGYQASVTQNGFAVGNLRRLSITDEGYVVGSYDNGTTRRLYKIPLATFVEENQLESISGTAFAQSVLSGDVTFSQAKFGAAGEMVGGALESSNVETETQLVDMIVAQRAYQSNTKVLTTADEMLRRLDQMMG